MQEIKHNSLGIVLQIFSGGFKKAIVDINDVINRITSILEKHAIDKVIIGWSIEQGTYDRLISYLHSKGIEVYYWFPIFSEIGILEDVDLIVDYLGNEIKGYSLKDEENFEFYCPTSSKNYEAIQKIYEVHIEQHDFDGVFIDKIRSSSFANGLAGAFSCFCSRCTCHYENLGLNVNELKQEISKYQNIDQESMTRDGRKENLLIEQFYQAKQDIYFQATNKVIKFFKSKNLKVGADTFAPSIAKYVGQDVLRLANVCDFIKPMMYQYTNAPAGIEFEYRMMQKALNDKGDSKLVVEQSKLRMDAKEITKDAHNVYFGVEVNRIENVADVYPKDVYQSMNTLDTENLQGYVLSWDLLSMPLDNLDAAFDYAEKRSEVLDE